MNPVALVSLLVAAAAVAAAAVTAFAVRTLRGELGALRRELTVRQAQAVVPGARTAPAVEEIRTAVAAALADERERELADARAFWAAQEAREAADAALFDGHGIEFPEIEALPYVPRQADWSGFEPQPQLPHRRHPSDPDFVPSPVVADPEETVARLAALADARTPLADVRPGPLGTLDLYVFADGTTLCLTPGHRETAEQLAAALERGEAPALLGGSAVSGAFALTFSYGEESVFVLADRVVASL
ncbi:hypothetical protein NON19_20660 [Streptomyces rubrisoli]|uniref:Secreted protein n=1 Tax=Streptantibioticus rubrisoli TaxID=1387313 RepID=A0ABT1PG90_9ACTN|nr:hypothetical protein [Streptantibioticus rubrisoli]MCQ4044375.1 hypothetical protein [Streptantibioticus rubrisoli]